MQSKICVWLQSAFHEMTSQPCCWLLKNAGLNCTGQLKKVHWQVDRCSSNLCCPRLNCIYLNIFKHISNIFPQFVTYLFILLSSADKRADFHLDDIQFIIVFNLWFMLFFCPKISRLPQSHKKSYPIFYFRKFIMLTFWFWYMIHFELFFL